MVYQFAWTLRQDERVTTFSITIGDQPVTMEGGTSQFSVELGSEYAPYDVQASSLLFRLRGGLLESGDSLTSAPVDGPLGQTQYGVEQVSVSLTAGLAASVSGGGTALSLSSVNDQTHPVTQVLSGATRLLTPAWDFADRLWLVDQADDGARISVIDTAATRTAPSRSTSPASPASGSAPSWSRGTARGWWPWSRASRPTPCGSAGSATTPRAGSPRGDPVAQPALERRGRPADPRHRLAVGDQHRRAVPAHPGRRPGRLGPGRRFVAQTSRVGLLDRGLALVASPAPNETLYIRTPDGLADPTGAEGGTAPLPPDVSSVGYAG